MLHTFAGVEVEILIPGVVLLQLEEGLGNAGGEGVGGGGGGGNGGEGI